MISEYQYHSAVSRFFVAIAQKNMHKNFNILILLGFINTPTCPYFWAMGCTAWLALFDGNRFGEVARLVDIAATLDRTVVGEELQRHDGWDGLEKVEVRGRVDERRRRPR